MEKETKDIASTVQEATQEVEDHLKETSNVINNIQSKFYRNLMIGQLSLAAVTGALLLLDKHLKK